MYGGNSDTSYKFKDIRKWHKIASWYWPSKMHLTPSVLYNEKKTEGTVGPKQKYQEESINERTARRLHLQVLKCVNVFLSIRL